MSHKKTVIYARFSSDMQRADSCTDQERDVRAGLTRKGIDPTNAVILRDEAESGTKVARDGFQQLCDMVARGEVGVLAVPKKRGPTRASAYKEFTGRDGARILVGKGGEQNDELTFHVARPWDIWLHARGVPGSHVVLVTRKNEEVPQEALLDAAHLAHHFSQRKGEPRGEITWVPARFVRKTKGAAPGQVTYTRDKTLMVRIEPDRMERLLK